MGFNSGLDIEKSYYVATANPAPAYPPLEGEVEADLVVVGGGCTGLSAALHAAERGLKVVLLEGGKIGWGASGPQWRPDHPRPAQGRRRAGEELTGASGRGRCSTWPSRRAAWCSV